jgi:hypothetical protein
VALPLQVQVQVHLLRPTQSHHEAVQQLAQASRFDWGQGQHIIANLHLGQTVGHGGHGDGSVGVPENWGVDATVKALDVVVLNEAVDVLTQFAQRLTHVFMKAFAGDENTFAVQVANGL